MENSLRTSTGILSGTAPAKINLSLRIGSKRTDGYHNLESIVVPLELSDLVSIAVDYSEIERRCYVEGQGISREQAAAISGSSNLAYRAAVFILENFSKKKDLGFEIRITKNIPLEAGLGGGSSDAAAVIRLLCEQLQVTLSESHLSLIASKLGADIPCLINPQIKLMTGRGEQLVELEVSSSINRFFKNDLIIGLVKPLRGLSTAEAYSWLNRKPDTTIPDLSAETRSFISFLAEERDVDEDYFADFKTQLLNDFQQPVLQHHLGVREIFEAVAAKRKLFPLLSGSGSTVIIFGFRSSGELRDLLAQFKALGFFTSETAIALN